jgi:large subunit ribosomal protein L22
MEVKAKLSFIRISNRKVGEIAALVRGKKIQEAINILDLSPRKRVAGAMRTLLKSAVANAAQKGTVDVDTLFVKEVRVGQGPTLKRFLTRAKGSASPLKKRTSHIWVTLDEK